jgi:phosphoenolpyruvate carboxylase
MARTHLATARAYNHGSEDKFNDLIANDYKKAEEAILKITDQKHVLDNSKVIFNSIRFRNPFTYPLNLMQVELLNRWKEKGGTEEETLRNALFLSINGIAAAMQSTG